MFADDKNFLYSDKYIKSMFKIVNQELKPIQIWFNPICTGLFLPPNGRGGGGGGGKHPPLIFQQLLIVRPLNLAQ